MNFIQEFIKRGSLMEGWRPGTRSWVNNNPGNLDAGARAIRKDPNGYAIYATVSDGWADYADLVERVIRDCPGITMYTFFAGQRFTDAAAPNFGKVVPGGYAGFAPAADPRASNAPKTYATFMLAAVGMKSIDDPLAAALQGSATT